MNRSPQALAACIDVAMRRRPADLVIKGARLFNLITGELLSQDIAICGDRIAAVGPDYNGKQVTPQAWERMVLPRGVTSAVCDPHELANVAGVAAIDAFIAASKTLLMNLQVQIPSCVPALPSEEAGAILDSTAIAPYAAQHALAEFMNVPGVL